MRLTRVHVDAELSAPGAFELPKSVTQHLIKVLRLRPGAELLLFNGNGADYSATLTSNSRVEIHTVQPGLSPTPLKLTLAQGLCRGEKMDLVLQKSTELGVTAIQPVNTQRSEVRLSEERLERRMAHWQQVIASACEQCGRAELPLLHAPLSLPEWLAQLAGYPTQEAQLRLVLDPHGDAHLTALPASDRLVALIGPEGGLDEKELRLCATQGFHRLRLGRRILRTETAGPALLAAVGALWGDLGA